MRTSSRRSPSDDEFWCLLGQPARTMLRLGRYGEEINPYSPSYMIHTNTWKYMGVCERHGKGTRDLVTDQV